MTLDLEQLRAEATRLGLPLDDDDLRAILVALQATSAELAALPDGGTVEPPYRFSPLPEGPAEPE